MRDAFGSEEKISRSIVWSGVKEERKKDEKIPPPRPFNEMYQVCHALYLTPFVDTSPFVVEDLRNLKTPCD